MTCYSLAGLELNLCTTNEHVSKQYQAYTKRQYSVVKRYNISQAIQQAPLGAHPYCRSRKSGLEVFLTMFCPPTSLQCCRSSVWISSIRKVKTTIRFNTNPFASTTGYAVQEYQQSSDDFAESNLLTPCCEQQSWCQIHLCYPMLPPFPLDAYSSAFLLLSSFSRRRHMRHKRRNWCFHRPPLSLREIWSAGWVEYGLDL